MSEASPGGGDKSPVTPGKSGNTAERFGRPDPPNWRAYAKFGLWIVLALLAITFVFGNSDEVEVNFLFQTSIVPLYVALLISLVLGIAIGSLGVWFLSRRRAKTKAAKVQAKDAK